MNGRVYSIYCMCVYVRYNMCICECVLVSKVPESYHVLRMRRGKEMKKEINIRDYAEGTFRILCFVLVILCFALVANASKAGTEVVWGSFLFK